MREHCKRNESSLSLPSENSLNPTSSVTFTMPSASKVLLNLCTSHFCQIQIRASPTNTKRLGICYIAVSVLMMATGSHQILVRIGGVDENISYN